MRKTQFGKPILTPLAEFQSRPLNWLWPGRIPADGITLVAGDPAGGKSFLTLDLAARISSGKSAPDGSCLPVGSVIVLAPEDSGTTMRRRLLAAGGDPSKVRLVEGLQPRRIGPPEPFSLGRDLRKLESAVRKLGDVRMIIVDPISSYLTRSESFSEADLRSVLHPLRAFAERHSIAVVVIMHLGKNRRPGPDMHRVRGMVAFTAIPRVVCLVRSDPSSASGDRLLTTAKFNEGVAPPAVRFRIVSGSDGTGRIEYVTFDVPNEPPVAHSAYEIAEHFLARELADGPVFSRTIFQRAAAAGIARSTIQRMKKRLAIRSIHQAGDPRWCFEWVKPGGNGTAPQPAAGD